MGQTEAFWVMVGSLATAGAVLVALIAFIFELRAARRDRHREDAREIRRNLQRLVDASHGLAGLLREGDPLIYGASTVADEFGKRLGPSTTAHDFWNELTGLNGSCLLAAVRGWDSSPETARLNRLLDRLEASSLPLNGLLTIVAIAGGLLSKIVRDSYSPIMFFNVLTALSHRDLKFFAQHKDEKDVHKLILRLAPELMGDTSGYFAARYLKAVEQLARFIKDCSSAIAALDDLALNRAARMEIRTPHTGSYTGEMKVLLGQLKSATPEKTYAQLSHLLDEIEVSVSKEAAAKELSKLPLRK